MNIEPKPISWNGQTYYMDFKAFLSESEIIKESTARLTKLINDRVSEAYKDGYEHGFSAGYEQGFAKGQLDISATTPPP